MNFNFEAMLVTVIAGLLIVATVVTSDEPKSQFEYESQILERLVRMQVRMEALESSLAQTNKNFESLLVNTTRVLDNRTTQLEDLRGTRLLRTFFQFMLYLYLKIYSVKHCFMYQLHLYFLTNLFCFS